MSDPGGRLTCYNFLNALAYLANFVVVHGIGVLGWFNLPDNAAVSAKYQTLVTPAGFSFAIWAVIFIFQAIFAIVQLLPAFRSRPLVQTGVRYWYGLVCIFQVIWTFAFAFEVIWLSCITMFLILFSLCGLLLSQRRAESDSTLKEYWLLRFPFQIHTGWIAAASVLNVNVALVSAGASASLQVFAAVISLLILLGTALTLLFRAMTARKLNIVIPLVLAWAVGGIWAELKSPQPSIQAYFNDSTIQGLQIGATVVCIIVLIAVCVRTVLYVVRKESKKEESVGEGDQLFADPEGSLHERTYT